MNYYILIIIRKDEVLTKNLMEKVKQEYESDKRKDTVTHVSDILPPPYCIRRAFYGRVYPEENKVTIESVNHFMRGQASEFAITKLIKAGVAQLNVEYGKTVKGHPDIAGSHIIYELKDTSVLNRIDFEDYTFKSYLRQLLYYMVMTEKDKGVISIKYNSPDLIFQRRVKEGELYLKPYGSKPGIESWDIYLAMDDPLRDELKKEILHREGLFQEALKTKSAYNLPRVPKEFEKSKCNYCPYKKMCFKDPESESAIQIKESVDLLDKEENVDHSKDVAPNII